MSTAEGVRLFRWASRNMTEAKDRIAVLENEIAQRQNELENRKQDFVNNHRRMHELLIECGVELNRDSDVDTTNFFAELCRQDGRYL